MQFGRAGMNADEKIAKIKVAFSRDRRINPSAAVSGRRKAPIVPSGCSSGVERNLAKVDVVGSNPIIRSKSFCKKTYANLDIARDYE